jgi:hypothetical protein
MTCTVTGNGDGLLWRESETWRRIKDACDLITEHMGKKLKV